ncbi:disease resistance protein At4g27190-like isoform X2 [Rhododendron vialii]|uniref:disease resistance protein At4g27190-like isoform X2 n=1 Tax=Rhododendron vialii TaxID=182163 RepID=UPI00265FEC89|nr:disease resistance protein At4g27190-like isoform X2 [Rhododendron vialii]
MADGILAIGGLVASAVSSATSAVQAVAQAKQVFWDPPMEIDNLPNNVEEIIDDLNDEVRKLGSKSKDFKNKILKNKTKAPSETYLEWVRTVEEIDKQVKDLLDEYDKQSKEKESWWFTSSPDFREDFKKMYKKVKSLGEESNQIKDKMFVDLLPELVVNKEGKNNNFGMRGKQIEKILDLLESSKAKKIGILGTVGIGKTTMMRSLNNHEKVTKTFEIVIWLDVSQERSRENLSREDLLQAIVRRLELSIGGSSKADEITSSNAHEVAKRILIELQDKKFLLLLDDVKECLNLSKIGIPESNIGSKIVLTTRLHRVCRPMVERIIKVTYLSLDEAWKMFQDVLKSSGVLEDPEIRKIAWRVCNECSGLPLLIQKVASTFKFKDNRTAWRDGLNNWRKWPEKDREGIKEVYNLLKFCYDDLDDEQRQKCFLYGALYPEGHGINADYLLECWAAENLLGDNDSITTELLKCGHHVLSHLKYVSLLENGESENQVTMHKFIRHLALYIAEDVPDCKYMVETSKGLREPPKVESWTEKNRISFGDNKLKQLPASPNCSKLSTLFLQKNSSLEKIPPTFFENMTELRILDVSHTGIKGLPSSLSFSKSLKVLYLNNCTNLVELPSHVVAALTRLEALDIVGSGVNAIPSQIEELTELRRLRVSFSKFGNENAAQEVNFNYKIISKLSRLEELVIDVKSSENWSNDVVENIVNEVATLQEFKSLKFCFSDKVVDVIEVFGSQNLRIRVPDATILLSFIKGSLWINVHDIENFEFYIGCIKSEHPQLPNFHEYVKYVKYCEIEGRNFPILEVLAEAAAFELVDNNNIKQLSDSELTNMKGIQSCLIEGCDAIETIVGTSNSVVLPSLEHLFIKNLPKLGSILKGPLQPGSLTKLKRLVLTGCQTLVKVFPPGSIQYLCEIQYLEIEKCDEIEEVISESDARGNLRVLPKLKKMVLQDMRKLRCICAIETLEWPSLEELKILNCPGLSILPGFA